MNSASSCDWNDDRILQLASLWKDGLTAGEIAAQLGGGITRSAVLGKVSRMGLPKRRQGSLTPGAWERKWGNRKLSAEKKRAPAKPMKPPEPKVAKVVTVESPRPAPVPRDLAWTALPHTHPLVPLLALSERTCKWPIGGEHGHFCGAESAVSKPYCAVHLSMSVGPGTRGERNAGRVQVGAAHKMVKTILTVGALNAARG